MFLGKYLFNFAFIFIFSSFLHALGTMHELSVGGCILHLIITVFILDQTKRKSRNFFVLINNAWYEFMLGLFKIFLFSLLCCSLFFYEWRLLSMLAVFQRSLSWSSYISLISNHHDYPSYFIVLYSCLEAINELAHLLDYWISRITH